MLAIMPQICKWLDANDIPHADVPVTEVPKIANGKITVRVNRRHNGRFYLDSGTDRLASQVRTFTLKVEPPAVLLPWLRGEVPAP